MYVNNRKKLLLDIIIVKKFVFYYLLIDKQTSEIIKIAIAQYDNNMVEICNKNNN